MLQWNLLWLLEVRTIIMFDDRGDSLATPSLRPVRQAKMGSADSG